jgi:hypothetical protein
MHQNHAYYEHKKKVFRICLSRAKQDELSLQTLFKPRFPPSKVLLEDPWLKFVANVGETHWGICCECNICFIIILSYSNKVFDC